MPISKKYLKAFRSFQSQYCTSKYGKAGVKDKPVDGIPSCPKGRQVFYATMKSKGIDYTKELALSPEDVRAITPKVIAGIKRKKKKKKCLSELSEKELLDLSVELLIKEREE